MSAIATKMSQKFCLVELQMPTNTNKRFTPRVRPSKGRKLAYLIRELYIQNIHAAFQRGTFLGVTYAICIGHGHATVA